MALNKTMTFDLELKPGGIPPIVHASQGDIGRMFKANIYWDGSAATSYISGATVNLRGRKPDKTVFDYSATLAGSMVTFETTEQMTIISGPVECELVFSNDGDVIASANFVLIVEESPYNPDALSESDIEGLTDVLEGFQRLNRDSNGVVKIGDGVTASGTAEPIKGFYVHDEVTNTDGVAKVSIDAVHEFVEDVSGTVENWLDEHPEATTTVQDGAVTTGKLANGAVTESKTDVDFLKSIKNAYVTPEMFGAKGDEVTDDTAALQAAIDSGLPVYGYYNKTYCAAGLNLKNYCELNYVHLKPPAGSSNTVGVTIYSHSIVNNCVFSNYSEACIKSCGDTATVHARIYKSLFQYSKNGVVLDQTTYSCNNIFIENSYFVKMGTNPDDFTTQPQTDGYGIGVKCVGNWYGVQIIGNVFEYNTNCGVSLVNTNTNYRVGAVVEANYFEGNKYSAVTVEIPTFQNFVKIAANYYSWLTTNVFNTRFLWWKKGCTSFPVESVSKITMSNCSIDNTNYLNRETGVATIPEGSSQYMAMVPINYSLATSRTFKLVYNATLNSNIQLRASDASTVLATLSNGRGVAFMRGDNSFFWNRVLASGEQIIIESYEPA